MRYALYFAPDAASDLWRFGCRVLGRDAATGQAPTALVPPGINPQTWAEWTAAPRRYGFHATLKAPFALAPGRTEDELFDAIAALASSREEFLLPPLRVAALGRFAALVPAESSQDLNDLANSCVREIDVFRAPLSAEALSRRLEAPLTARQHEQLMRWGYPYVFDDFQFHMTLTGSLPPEAVACVAENLQGLFDQEAAAEAVTVDALALFIEDQPGAPFTLVRRFPLAKP